jgi:hypothetical protein
MNEMRNNLTRPRYDANGDLVISFTLNSKSIIPARHIPLIREWLAAGKDPMFYPAFRVDRKVAAFILNNEE